MAWLKTRGHVVKMARVDRLHRHWPQLACPPCPCAVASISLHTTFNQTMSQEEKSVDWVRGYPKKVKNVTWINHAQYPRERKWPLAFWDGCDHEGNFYVNEQRQRLDPEKPIGWHGIEDPYFSVIIRSAEDWRPETFNQVRKAMVYIHRDVNVYKLVIYLIALHLRSADVHLQQPEDKKNHRSSMGVPKIDLVDISRRPIA